MDLDVQAYQSAEEFLAAYEPTGPGCLVLDVRVPGMSGMELQRRLTVRREHVADHFYHGPCRRAVWRSRRWSAATSGFWRSRSESRNCCEKIQNAVQVGCRGLAAAGGARRRQSPACTTHACPAQGGRPGRRRADQQDDRPGVGAQRSNRRSPPGPIDAEAGIESRTELVRLMAAIAGLGIGEKNSGRHVESDRPAYAKRKRAVPEAFVRQTLPGAARNTRLLIYETKTRPRVQNVLGLDLDRNAVIDVGSSLMATIVSIAISIGEKIVEVVQQIVDYWLRLNESPPICRRDTLGIHPF